MDFADFAFYFNSVTILVSALMVVFSRSAVHSVLWLVLAFFSSSGLFVLLGAEFVAMIMVIVYVGAVAVLFLFVVMMLDVDFVKLRAGMSAYLPVGLLIALVLLVQLGFAFGNWEITDLALAQRGAVTPDRAEVENTMALGDVLYTQYALVFQLAGLILLVAMIGAIVLTLRHRTGVKRQNVLEQMYRDPKTAIVMKDVKPGQGL